MNPSIPPSVNDNEVPSDVLAKWGQAAQELYNRYHLLNDIDLYVKQSPLDEASSLMFKELHHILVETMVNLTEDMPSRPDEDESKLTPEESQALSLQLWKHTQFINSKISQVDAGLEQLYKQYPQLPKLPTE
ncbi:hypothetical protein [Tellurirhabdus bombi]|uniref:hypothetical protein n=1 Tax=Tellurirhabdus bombi TaxID=2907205 RepID=UPI001F15EA41|nr:hypothetical protein [Tellurirhabdus bombi]